jgi:hypothetical protein
LKSLPSPALQEKIPAVGFTSEFQAEADGGLTCSMVIAGRKIHISGTRRVGTIPLKTFIR